MPDIEQNHRLWQEVHPWTDRGEAWSDPWGGSDAQWSATIAPRLRSFLPTGAVLEIAPGYGRWTKFLLRQCIAYHGVDLAQRCVTACQVRFGDTGRFDVTDGLSLAMVPSEPLFDLVFSFDSLVHAEMSVFDAYVPQIMPRLAPYGVAFLHHSNLAALGDVAADYWRGATVSADSVRHCVESAGGQVLRQEIVPCMETARLDCMTLFARPGDYDERAAAVVTNDRFVEEAELVRTGVAPWGFNVRSKKAVAQWL